PPNRTAPRWTLGGLDRERPLLRAARPRGLVVERSQRREPGVGAAPRAAPLRPRRAGGAPAQPRRRSGPSRAGGGRLGVRGARRLGADLARAPRRGVRRVPRARAPLRPRDAA